MGFLRLLLSTYPSVSTNEPLVGPESPGGPLRELLLERAAGSEWTPSLVINNLLDRARAILMVSLGIVGSCTVMYPHAGHRHDRKPSKVSSIFIVGRRAVSFLAEATSLNSFANRLAFLGSPLSPELTGGNGSESLFDPPFNLRCVLRSFLRFLGQHPCPFPDVRKATQTDLVVSSSLRPPLSLSRWSSSAVRALSRARRVLLPVVSPASF